LIAKPLLRELKRLVPNPLMTLILTTPKMVVAKII
jgi:hypothetical protein